MNKIRRLLNLTEVWLRKSIEAATEKRGLPLFYAMTKLILQVYGVVVLPLVIAVLVPAYIGSHFSLTREYAARITNHCSGTLRAFAILFVVFILFASVIAALRRK